MPDILAVLRADTAEFTAKMAEAKGEVEDLSDSGSSNFSKLSTIGKGALLGIGAAVLGVGAVSVDLAAKFQGTVASIAANAGISTAAAQKIGSAFLSTAGTTIYSGQQIATAYAAVAGQLGTTQGHALNASQAMTVMKAAMDLAEGSGTSLGTATTALAGTMQAYQVKANGAAGVSNVLFSAARLTGQGVDAVSAAVDRVHTKLGALTPPLGQVGGLLVDMTEHGETGRAAMSALTATFTTLLKPATDVATAQANLKAAADALPPSLRGLAAQVTSGAISSKAATTAAEGLGTAQAALFSKFVSASSAAATAGQATSKLGISVTTAGGKMRPLSQIIGELHNQIKGMSSAQATAQLGADGFGSSAAKLLSVVQAGPAAFDRATSAVTKTNAAHAAAEKQAQTFDHQMETLKAQAEDYATMLGGKLIPILERVATTVAKVVEWLARNKPVAIALAAVIGGVLVGATIAWTASLFAAGGALAFITAPILAVIAAAALLAVGAYEIVKHWGAISGFFVGIWHDVEHIFDDAVDFIKSHLKDFVEAAIVIFTGGIGLLPVLVYRYWKQIEDGFKDAIKLTVGFVEKWWPEIFAIATGGMSLLVGFLLSHWSEIVSDVSGFISSFVGFFTSLPSRVISAVDSLGGLLIGWITTAWNGFKSLIEGYWNLEVTFWTTIPAKLVNAVTSFGGLLLGWIEAAWGAFKSLIEGYWNTEVSFWTSIPSKLISGLSSLAGLLAGVATTAWNGFSSAVKTAWSAVASWFSGIPGDIVSAIGSVTNLLYNIGVAIIDSLKRGIVDAFNDVKNFVGGIASTIASLKGPISYDATLLTPHGNAIMQSLLVGLQQGFSGKVAPYMSGVAGQISGTNFGATAGITPLSSLGGGGGAAAAAAGQAGANTPVILQLDGQTFATAILPSLQSIGALKQRTLPLPIFGTANS